MSKVTNPYLPPQTLVLGSRLNIRVPHADQRRQRLEVEEILRRLRGRPGVVLADEVGMGKTFVALAVSFSIAMHSPRGPVLLMVPPNLIGKWEQDLKAFCELYLDGHYSVRQGDPLPQAHINGVPLRYGIARHSIELMALMDDPKGVRCHLIFVGQGAMARNQTSMWVRLALVAESLRRHGRGGANRLIQVKRQIHRFLARLLWAVGHERGSELGDELWQELLSSDPSAWKNIYNEAVKDPVRQLADDPVPKAVVRALHHVSLDRLADALKAMPVRAVGGEDRVAERIANAREALRAMEKELWGGLLAKMRWRSPLLVMDEAHHLKNPGTALAKSLQNPISDEDLRIGDGAMARRFDRMMFLTATPFQLGHRELVRVLERFGDVRWEERELGPQDAFCQQLRELGEFLDSSQRAAIALQRAWTRLRPDDCTADAEVWWSGLLSSPRASLSCHQRAVVEAFEAATGAQQAAQIAMRPWILRHNKGDRWAGSEIARRCRVAGAELTGSGAKAGLPIPPEQLLPFFLAARGATATKQDLLGEALSSSYEAFRYTRQNKDAGKDDLDEETVPEVGLDLASSDWYLGEFDRVLERCSGLAHPKINATVKKVVDLWEAGEKVLIFAFYRRTCHALRLHIGHEIERRIMLSAEERLRLAGLAADRSEIEVLLERIQKSFFDNSDAPGRRALNAALGEIVGSHAVALRDAGVTAEQQEELLDVMRRFLRVATTLVRCFPITEVGAIDPAEAVKRMLDQQDGSGISWRQKFVHFITFLTERCVAGERGLFLDAARHTRTGRIRVENEEGEGSDGSAISVILANAQVATGKTPPEARTRLMRAFNTPFFPDILVCSEVMGEGVDLQRFCRHVIHHDLAWNPSVIEQRTGRIDRLGCKAEGRNPIMAYLPYLAGAADERQFKVMAEREQWFQVVMGQDKVAELITPDSQIVIELPRSAAAVLSFDLSAGMGAPPGT